MNEPSDFISRYLAMWNEPDPSLRGDAVTELYGENARYCNARTEYRGREAIVTAVTTSHDRWVQQGYHFRVRAAAAGHHGGLRFSWEMVPDGTDDVTSIGTHFFLMEDDRILLDYQFIDK